MSALGWKMGREVGLIAAKCQRAVRCAPCGIGIAVDVVGRRYGEEPYDWRAKHDGHDCANIRHGLTEDKKAAILSIAQWLERGPSTGVTYQQPIVAVDSRLPPEKDEEVPF